jgi:NAD(P)-dependent dehydrogenase (short-subunit alcohol dehydrogenase family)
MVEKESQIKNFSGKTILVTGGGSGIGKTIARRFAEAGGDLCVHYRSSREEAEETAAYTAGFGGKGAAVGADLLDSDAVEGLFRRIEKRFGRLDVLVNNAGIYPVEPLLSIGDRSWDRMLEADLKGPFLCVRYAAELMIRKGIGGAVVNIASIEGENPAPGHAHYAAAKGGLIMFTKAAAGELGPYGIRVNAVSPGLIYRQGLEQVWPEGIEAYLKQVPLGRLGTARDVADAVHFLASDNARWITGVNLRVDGGVGTGRGY